MSDNIELGIEFKGLDKLNKFLDKIQSKPVKINLEFNFKTTDLRKDIEEKINNRPIVLSNFEIKGSTLNEIRKILDENIAETAL